MFESLERRRVMASAASAVLATTPIPSTPRQVEALGRGLVALNKGSGQVFVSWRMLANDPDGIRFNLYRSVNGAAAVLRATITSTTNFTDTAVDTTKSNAYFVRPVIDGVEQAAGNTFTLPANAPARQFQYLAFNKPANMTMPDGTVATYSPNDASVGDVDGDGEYELIVKWDPSNSKDNSQSGYTGNVYVDCYEMDGSNTQLWRIDLGRNIRAGAHYTQFIVYDFNGDGKAEIAMKTAPGTVDGRGQNVLMNSDNPTADYRNSSGYILSGPEYLTMFNGQTGANLATVAYNPPRGTVSSWGDSYGNRVDRFLAGVAYLDGVRPSLIMSRGYYTRAVIAAWDWNGTSLTSRWTFDSNTAANGSAYRGQGAHSLSVADVDNDGKDEIIFGAATIDDNGKGLYSTGKGHGDALHVGDLVPGNPGLEVFMVHETESAHGGNGGTMTDARTGQMLWSIPGTGDVGRGVSFDIDPRYPGSESWDSSNSNVYKSDGTIIAGSSKGSTNFSVWWDGDLSQELLDDTTIAKWNTATNRAGSLLNLYNATTSPVDSNNTTKATPMLSGDIFGDWREEVILRDVNTGAGAYVFSTTTPTNYRMPTLMHDTQYREAIAWQNVAYNQPPHPSTAVGDGVFPGRNVRYAGNDAPPAVVSTRVGKGTAQRSVVSSFQLTFGEPVTLYASGVSVTQRGGPNLPFTLSGSDDEKTYTLLFDSYSVPDGVYDVKIIANAVRDSVGNPMAADQSFSFHRLLGDGDGNRVVDFNDFLGLQNAFGTQVGDLMYRVEYDLQGDGFVDFNDFLTFQNRFGFTI